MRLCITGSGTAGIEALLAARARLGQEADLVLVAPEPEFRYRPMTPGSLLRPAAERMLRIADVAAHAGAELVPDAVEAVHEPEQQLLTRSGDTVEFDCLLLAVGARPERALRQGHVWMRGGDPGCLDEIIAAARTGTAESVAVVVPHGARWAIAAYELALVLAWTLQGTGASVTLLTAEDRPLAALGSEATRLVSRELEEASVELIAGAEVSDELADGKVPAPGEPARLRIGASGAREFDTLISLPRVLGPFLGGTPMDAAGFIQVDEGLKLCGSEHAWAVGRCIAAALEQDGLGARQADAAIEAIAGNGQPAAAPPLTGVLLAGQREAWLAENPPGTREPSTRCLWWPPGRAVGHMLAQRIAAWDPLLDPAFADIPAGVLIDVPVALGCSETFLAPAGRADAETRHARLVDIENRQVMAIRRQERSAEEDLRALRGRLEEFSKREQDVVRELQRHGYLKGAPRR